MARRAADHGQGAPPMDDRLLRERPPLVIRGAHGEDLPAAVVGGIAGAHLDVALLGDRLAAGSVVEVVYARWDDATYRFSSRVLVTAGTEGGDHRLAWPREIHREQHRLHVRATMALPVEVAVAGPQVVGGVRAPSKGPLPGWHHADLVDLSGGGAAVVAPTGLRAGQIVLLRGEVAGRDGGVALEGRARVVRTVPVSRRDGSPGVVAAYGLEFIDLTQGEQDRLVGTILWRKATSTLS